MNLTGPWQRNLSVQTRLADGTLVLKLGETTRLLAEDDRQVWYALSGDLPVDQHLSDLPAALADELEALAAGGFLVPAAPASDVGRA